MEYKPFIYNCYRKKVRQKHDGNLYLYCHPNLDCDYRYMDIQIIVYIEKEEDVDEIKECLFNVNVNCDDIHNLRELRYFKHNVMNLAEIEKFIVPFDFDVINSKLREMGYELFIEANELIG